MTAEIVKLKQKPVCRYERRLRQAIDIVKREGRKVCAVGFFVRTKNNTYYECSGLASDMIVGAEYLKREIMDFAMQPDGD